MKQRAELLEDINDYLDSLTDIQCQNILRRVSTTDLVELWIALRQMCADIIVRTREECLEECQLNEWYRDI